MIGVSTAWKLQSLKRVGTVVMRSLRPEVSSKRAVLPVQAAEASAGEANEAKTEVNAGSQGSP